MKIQRPNFYGIEQAPRSRHLRQTTAACPPTGRCRARSACRWGRCPQDALFLQPLRRGRLKRNYALISSADALIPEDEYLSAYVKTTAFNMQPRLQNNS